MQLTRTMLAICIACLSIVVSNAFAEPALVIKIDDLEGYVFDGDGNGGLVFCDSITVETNSMTGVITVSCRGKGVPNNSGQAVKFDIYNNPFYWLYGDEVLCGFFASDGSLVFTSDWTETVSASGNFVFRCKVKID